RHRPGPHDQSRASSPHPPVTPFHPPPLSISGTRPRTTTLAWRRPYGTPRRRAWHRREAVGWLDTVARRMVQRDRDDAAPRDVLLLYRGPGNLPRPRSRRARPSFLTLT